MDGFLAGCRASVCVVPGCYVCRGGGGEGEMGYATWVRTEVETKARRRRRRRRGEVNRSLLFNLSEVQLIKLNKFFYRLRAVASPSFSPENM